MKKILTISLVMILLFTVGCRKDLPPEPGAPQAPVGEATAAIAEGYAPPYDIFNNNKAILDVSVISKTDTNAQISSSADLQGGFIYKYGYIYTNTGWRIYEFPQSAVSGSNWIKDHTDARITVELSALQSEGENYVLAYTCKKYNNQWKCGCRSENDCG
ncbi:hypothetical protein KY345_04100, partial [Candidatus Woesearchaeota archaeon]|nr:hypothetical protein [Candidatus Woesearchaeota archaeon]